MFEKASRLHRCRSIRSGIRCGRPIRQSNRRQAFHPSQPASQTSHPSQPPCQAGWHAEMWAAGKQGEAATATSRVTRQVGPCLPRYEQFLKKTNRKDLKRPPPPCVSATPEIECNYSSRLILTFSLCFSTTKFGRALSLSITLRTSGDGADHAPSIFLFLSRRSGGSI